jgi:riboflavin biosynthesis pyrimidine reductase
VRRCDLVDCFKSLKRAGINSLLVEGGANIIQSVLESNLANQVVVTVRPCFLGGYRSLTHELQQPLDLLHTAAASVGGDIVIFGRLQQHNCCQEQGSDTCSIEDHEAEVSSKKEPRRVVEFLT